jgi:hypothetical protein
MENPSNSLTQLINELIKALSTIYLEYLKQQQALLPGKYGRILIKFLLLFFISSALFTAVLLTSSILLLLIFHSHGLTWVNSLGLILAITMLLLLPVIYSLIQLQKQLS